jgi:hypothetical protein
VQVGARVDRVIARMAAWRYSPIRILRVCSWRAGSECGRVPGSTSCWLCQLSRLLIDYVSAILPRAQAVSRMPSTIAALRMCCQRRVAAGTCWRMRDRQRRKFRSSSWPRQYRLADPVLFNPSIGRHRPLMPRDPAQVGCPGIGIVAVRGDPIRGYTGHRLCRSKKALAAARSRRSLSITSTNAPLRSIARYRYCQ